MSKLYFHLKLFFVAPKDKELFSYIHNKFGFVPKDLSLYQLCFIHKSSSQAIKLGCNERLEFLGDAILDSVTADYLYNLYPNEKEGSLTEMRARIVNRKNLNSIGIDLELHRHILAKIPQLKHNDAVGNCLEALIGAIYEDQGYKVAKHFIIEKIIRPHINIKQLPKNDTNFKSRVIQFCQRNKMSYEFNTTQIDGAKFPTFNCEIIVNGEKIAEATAKSKKSAEQNAANKAIKPLKTMVNSRNKPNA